MNGVPEFPRFGEVRSGGFAPEHVRVGRVSKAARDSRIDAAAELIEAFRRAFAVYEFPVAWVRVRKQQPGRVGVRARDEDRWHAANIGGETRRHEFLDELPRGHDDFSARCPHSLPTKAGLKVNACRARFNHRFHQFVGVQRAAKAGFRVGDDRCEPIRGGLLASADSIWSARSSAR